MQWRPSAPPSARWAGPLGCAEGCMLVRWHPTHDVREAGHPAGPPSAPPRATLPIASRAVRALPVQPSKRLMHFHLPAVQHLPGISAEVPLKVVFYTPGRVARTRTKA